MELIKCMEKVEAFKTLDPETFITWGGLNSWFKIKDLVYDPPFIALKKEIGLPERFEVSKDEVLFITKTYKAKFGSGSYGNEPKFVFFKSFNVEELVLHLWE